jgi:hypothetical protein
MTICVRGPRAVAVAAVVVAIVAAPMALALAGPTISATVDAPDDGALVGGTVDIQASAESAAGIKRIEISIDSFGVASKQPSTFQQDATVGYSWSSNDAPDSSSMVPNGRHTITVRAVATGGADDSASIQVDTNNPPVTPAGLDARAEGGDVVVSWSANPEPDLIAYVVERDSGSGYAEVGRVDAPAFRETLVAGEYSYRVAAVRASPVTADGISSPATAPVTLSITSPRGGGSGSVTSLTGNHALTKGSPFSQRGDGGSALDALLSGSALPDAGALPAIPSLDDVPWGTFERDLPYGEAPPALPELRSRSVSASSGPLSVVPPDGLRWVAAGLLLIVCAALSRILATVEIEVPPLAAARRSVTRWFTRPDATGPHHRRPPPA